MRCVKYLMFQSWLNKKTFTSISLGIRKTYHSAESLMWLWSLDCFMQKGQDESVDSAEMISVPFGLRHKTFSRCPGVLFWYSDHSSSTDSKTHAPWCPYDGKVFKNVLWRKTGSPQPLNKPLFLLRCQTVLVEGPRLPLECLESLRYIEIVLSRHHLTSNHDELRFRQEFYSKLGACRYHIVVFLILLYMSIHTTQVCIYGNIMEHMYIYIYVHAVYMHDFDLQSIPLWSLQSFSCSMQWSFWTNWKWQQSQTNCDDSVSVPDVDVRRM